MTVSNCFIPALRAVYYSCKAPMQRLSQLHEHARLAEHVPGLLYLRQPLLHLCLVALVLLRLYHKRQRLSRACHSLMSPCSLNQDVTCKAGTHVRWRVGRTLWYLCCHSRAYDGSIVAR